VRPIAADNDESGEKNQSRTSGAKLLLKHRGGGDAEETAGAFGKPEEEPGEKCERRKRRQCKKQQAGGAEDAVGDFILQNQRGETDAGEEEQGIDALPDDAESQ